MKKKNKICAICSGGDWADASVAHIVLPKEVNLEKERKRYNKWLTDVWYKRKKWEEKYPGKEIRWYNFDSFLIELCNGRRATDDDLEIFWED